MPKKEKQPSARSCMGLAQCREAHGGPASVPKGFVPVLVGPVEGGSSAERVLVKVKQFKDPRVATLLEMAEVEMGGCRQQGVLRVTCDAQYFRTVVGSTGSN